MTAFSHSLSLSFLHFISFLSHTLSLLSISPSHPFTHSPPDIGGEREGEGEEEREGGRGWASLPSKVFEFSAILRTKVFFCSNRIAVNVMVGFFESFFCHIFPDLLYIHTHTHTHTQRHAH